MLYEELKERDYTNMDKVVLRGCMGSVLLYILVGTFGYLTFANDVFN